MRRRAASHGRRREVVIAHELERLLRRRTEAMEWLEYHSSPLHGGGSGSGRRRTPSRRK